MKNKIKYLEIENKLGYEFNNKTLLLQAFTRSSYSAEHIEAESNEVLEFIGDSVLSAITVKHLSERYSSIKFNNYFFSELKEDELSKMKIDVVKRSTLAIAIERLDLHNYLLVGKSDEKMGVQNEASVKEDLFEAIIGAIAIDSNWNFAIIETIILNILNIDEVIENGDADEVDYEKELEAWFAKNNKKISFEKREYRCGNLDYSVSVNLGMQMLGFEAWGYGKTEHGARKMAAKKALEFIGNATDRATKIKAEVGNPDRERAVNQLQELWQKKIIPEPQYSFIESEKSTSGNSLWECSCKIEGIYDSSGGYICESKAKAKKQIAYDALMYLVGCDLKLLFINNENCKGEN